MLRRTGNPRWEVWGLSGDVVEVRIFMGPHQADTSDHPILTPCLLYAPFGIWEAKKRISNWSKVFFESIFRKYHKLWIVKLSSEQFWSGKTLICEKLSSIKLGFEQILSNCDLRKLWCLKLWSDETWENSDLEKKLFKSIICISKVLFSNLFLYSSHEKRKYLWNRGKIGTHTLQGSLSIGGACIF